VVGRDRAGLDTDFKNWWEVESASDTSSVEIQEWLGGTHDSCDAAVLAVTSTSSPRRFRCWRIFLILFRLVWVGLLLIGPDTDDAASPLEDSAWASLTGAGAGAGASWLSSFSFANRSTSLCLAAFLFSARFWRWRSRRPKVFFSDAPGAD